MAPARGVALFQPAIAVASPVEKKTNWLSFGHSSRIALNGAPCARSAFVREHGSVQSPCPLFMHNTIFFMFDMIFLSIYMHTRGSPNRRKDAPMSSVSRASVGTTPSDILLNKIGWLCQTVRVMIVILLCWLFVKTGIYWMSDAKIVAMTRLTLQVDVSGLTSSQKFLGFALDLATGWALNFAAYFSLWQLFSGFLRGEIFTVAAALRLRRAGLFVLTRAAVIPLWRSAEAMIVTAHLSPDGRVSALHFLSGDFSNLLVGAVVVALAQVFLATAEIAAENAQIV
jgi:hypothetical protein